MLFWGISAPWSKAWETSSPREGAVPTRFPSISQGLHPSHWKAQSKSI